MKLLKYCLVFFIFSNLGLSQNQNPELYNRPFVIFEGCEESEDKERCYEILFHEFLAKHVNYKTLKDTIFFKAKKDTISIHTSILYDEGGKVVEDYSNISSPLSKKPEALKYILDSIPLVKPALDIYNNGVSFNARYLFGFLLDKVNDSIVPILGYTPSEVPFAFIEKVPVYRGCDENMTNEELKNCMNDKVRDVISKNFNQKLARKLKLSPGIKRINVMFKVDKKGRVSEILARGPHPTLEKEAIRVIKKIPKLKKPGYQKGKPVIVPYAIPIVFRVTN
ncbi:energy transducer TonB [Winogradskyella sp.]|uniref:energy transducer TonB n=1 Tax=Winogradskyella sp. TaxID=1883156 RepID=UPI0026350B0E|nr:energy transducer TonB [Winogradskyella sp.]